jgi:hypothetical protein
MLNETTNRVFHVKGVKLSTSDITNEMYMDALDDDTYKALPKSERVIDKVNQYTRFDWHFRNADDMNAGDVELRTQNLEGYILADMNDEEKAEMRNVAARRVGSRKISAVANSMDTLIKFLRQNSGNLDPVTAESIHDIIGNYGADAQALCKSIMSGTSTATKSEKITIKL